jgi:hypothetical protein
MKLRQIKSWNEQSDVKHEHLRGWKDLQPCGVPNSRYKVVGVSVLTSFQLIKNEVSDIQYKCSAGLIDDSVLLTLKIVTANLDEAWKTIKSSGINVIIEVFPKTTEATHYIEKDGGYSYEKTYTGPFTTIEIMYVTNSDASFFVERVTGGQNHKGVGIFVDIGIGDPSKVYSQDYEYRSKETELGLIMRCFQKYIDFSTLVVYTRPIGPREVQLRFWCNFDAR